MSTSKQAAPDCCAEPGAGLMSVADARERINALLDTPQGEEQINLRSALGRVLSRDIISTINVPSYTNSAMDGYAVHSSNLPGQGACELKLIGTALAGTPFTEHMQPGQCVRIMTGAMLPPGADTVIMQEQVEREGDVITIQAGHKPDQNVRHAGEDMAAGKPALPRGTRLMPAELGVIASLGLSEVHVHRRLRVAIFSTGDELCSVGEALGEGQIYDSNRYTLYGMLTRLGVELLDMGVIRDQREAIQAAFKQAAALADVVITSGGVSVGEADFVKETLAALGQVNFWKIAMKPGKPLAFGKVDKALFFGLPGNPVSVMATFYQFVQPALKTLMGLPAEPGNTLQLTCTCDLKKAPGRTDFQRGILETDGDGRMTVSGTGMQGSHVLTSMSKANCFIILPQDNAGVKAGETVEVQPFAGLI